MYKRRFFKKTMGWYFISYTLPAVLPGNIKAFADRGLNSPYLVHYLPFDPLPYPSFFNLQWRMASTSLIPLLPKFEWAKLIQICNNYVMKFRRRVFKKQFIRQSCNTRE